MTRLKEFFGRRRIDPATTHKHMHIAAAGAADAEKFRNIVHRELRAIERDSGHLVFDGLTISARRGKKLVRVVELRPLEAGGYGVLIMGNEGNWGPLPITGSMDYLVSTVVHRFPGLLDE
jgi:hypothetical protein